jgi:hypothetical protein
LAGSPLAGYGQTFYNAGAANGIDPRLLVALAYAKSSDGRNITSGTNNIFNWQWNHSDVLNSPFSSIAAAISAVAIASTRAA